MKERIKTLLILSLIAVSVSQEYKIQFSHIPIGQGLGLSDSISVSNSIGAVLSNNMSSDSFSVGTGFLQTTQSVFSEPPVISSFNLPDIMFKTGQSVLITATLYDLNGLKLLISFITEIFILFIKLQITYNTKINNSIWYICFIILIKYFYSIEKSHSGHFFFSFKPC